MTEPAEQPPEQPAEPPPEPAAPAPPPPDARAREVARGALRFWAVAGSVYGGLLAAAVALYVPWKTPWINALLVAYGLAWPIAGHGLWRQRRWGWSLAVRAALVGFVLLVAVTAGLLGSWAYLHGIYGDFGFGASIGALLFASVALQLLGLVPGLALRGLLRREVRQAMGSRGPWGRALLGLGLLPLLVAGLVDWRYGMDPLPSLSAEARGAALAHVRAALARRPLPALTALEGVPVGAAELFVTLYDRGRIVARVAVDGDDLAEAVAKAATELAAHPRLAGRAAPRGRLKFDRVTAVAPVLHDSAPVVALSVNPGVDGLRRVGADVRRTLLPEDLVRAQRFGLAPLVPGIREMRFGLDGQWALKRLGLPDARLERVRTEGWVEHAQAELPTRRGNTDDVEPGPEGWRIAAVAGGHFIERQLMDDGRFHYQYYPFRDRHPPPDPRRYSLPRHAGTVYALALLHGLTGEASFKGAAERAIAWLNGRIPKACGDPQRACVVKQGRVADLGSSALTLVGMLEYTRRTNDRRYLPTIERLVNFVRWLQKPNGDFFHIYDVREQVIRKGERKMFYSEEAALALLMAHEITGDPATLAAAERALDFLTGPKYADFFLGRFIYGADHWTCIAADEAWPRLKKPAYLDFCLGYSRFIRRLQYEQRGWDQADFAGHYGFTGFMVPQAPAAAGFTEAVISTWSLSRKHGQPAEDIRAQASAALDALAREHIRPANSWMMPRPAFAAGGIRRSLVESEVRIDFTQHAATALIRGVNELVDREAG